MAAYTRQTLNNDNINRRPKAREEMFQGLTLDQELQTIIVAEKVRMSLSYGWAPVCYPLQSGHPWNHVYVSHTK